MVFARALVHRDQKGYTVGALLGLLLRRRVLPLLAATTLTLAAAPAAQAAIVFNGSPGTGSPPATLGGYPMTAFGADSRPLNTDVTTVTSPIEGNVAFNPALEHEQVGNGWATWSNGYTGDVYFAGGSSVALTLPAGTTAFYLYAEPNEFESFDVSATAQDGTTSGPVSVYGDAGAQYFGFYGTSGDTIETITVSNADPQGFAVGEFGISYTPPPPTVGVALSSTSIPADGVATTTATATVAENGSPLSGQSVSFSSTDTGEHIGPVTDNGNGTYTATITASTTVGAPTITATDNSASPTVSGSTPLTQTAPVASAVTFGTEPHSVLVGQDITGSDYSSSGGPVTVRLVDSNGVLVTTSSASVTVALGSNPGGATLGGTTTVAAVNGVATFPNLTINQPGVGYTLIASSPSLTSATSSAFDAQSTAAPCANQTTCTTTLSSSSTDAQITANPAAGGAPDSGVLTESFDEGPALTCTGYKPISSQWVYFEMTATDRSKSLSWTNMHPALQVGQTLKDLLTVTEMCYGAPYQFKTKSGAPATKTTWPNGTVEYVGLLPDCPSGTRTGPCVTSRSDNPTVASVTIDAFVPAGLSGDPRMRS